MSIFVVYIILCNIKFSIVMQFPEIAIFTSSMTGALTHDELFVLYTLVAIAEYSLHIDKHVSLVSSSIRHPISLSWYRQLVSSNDRPTQNNITYAGPSSQRMSGSQDACTSTDMDDHSFTFIPSLRTVLYIDLILG